MRIRPLVEDQCLLFFQYCDMIWWQERYLYLIHDNSFKLSTMGAGNTDRKPIVAADGGLPEK